MTGVILGGALVGMQALSLYVFGQPFLTEESSQGVADWYTLSHIIHGFIFYWLAKLLFPGVSWQWRLLMAIALEVGWEVLENTPMLIEMYQSQVLSEGYVGDSIVNSVVDTLAAMLGFFLALKLPTRIIIALALVMEVVSAVLIRDNLTLNVLNFIYQFEFIREWQSGG